ncbi:MAG: hypothetical protein ACI3U8_03660, partial [Candidatus Onthomonas sp.]
MTLEGDYTTADVKAELRRIILLEDDTVVNVSKYGVSASDMDVLVAEVLEENYLTSFVTVTCAVNSDGIATHLVIQRSEALSLAKDEMSELSENAPATVNPDEGVAAVDGEGEGGGQATGLTDDEKQELLSLYALYLQTYVDYPQYLGVLDPYFYTKNTDTSPMGAMLVVAGIPQAAIDYGQVSYNDLFGCIMTFYLGNLATVQYYGSAIISAKDEALAAVKNSGAKTYVDKLLVLTDWLANHASFDMPYIMNQSQKDEEGNTIEMMVAEEETEGNQYLASGELEDFCNEVLTPIFEQGAMEDGREEGKKVGYAAYMKENYADVYNAVYDQMYQAVYDQVYSSAYDAMIEQGLSEEQAKGQADHVATIEAEYAVAQQAAQQIDSQAAAVLTINIVDADKETLATKQLTQTGTKGETATFTAADIEAAVKEILPEDYELVEPTYADAEVAYGEEQTLSFTAAVKVESADAKLNISIVNADEETLATKQLTQTGTKGETKTFTAAEIEAAVKEILPKDYELVEPTYADTEVAYGEERTLSFTAAAVSQQPDPDTENADDENAAVETAEDAAPASQPTPAADSDAQVMAIAAVEGEEESADETETTTVDAAATAYAEAYAEEYAKEYAKQYAAQVAPQFAAALAPQVAGSWTGNLVGALCLDSCVCKAYTYAFNYIVQWMNPGVYGKNGDSTDLSDADNWKSAEDLFYVTDGQTTATAEDGTALVDADGNEITTEDKTFSIDAGYVVDSVRITYNKSVSMYGEVAEDFTSDHYWSAVKVDGEWYYIDSCYADIYIECMMRSRVETDGYINNLYFMISDASAREMYDGYYDSDTGLDTLYDSRNNSGVSDDTGYEHTWFSFAKSQVYSDGSGYYYMYDDTDALNELGKKNDQSGSNWDEEEEPTEYRLVYRPMDSANSAEKGGDSYTVEDDDNARILVKVNEGTYRDADGNMVESELLQELYSRYLEYAENYPAVFVSMAYDDGIAYLSLANTVLAYDVEAGTLTRVLEYNEVYAVRDKTNAFGGMAFTVADDADGADLSITNPPIAAINIVGDDLVVSLATNYAFISGKSGIEDKSSFGYEFQETNYNASYINYADYGVDLGGYGGQLDGLIEQEDNDNDEFMWAANFVDTISVSELAGTDHNYEKVTVDPTCGIDGYTEYRCSDCGRIYVASGEDDEMARVEIADSALQHHFIHFEETYYTKEDDEYKSGEAYVCAECLHSVNDLSDDEDADNSEWEMLESGETDSGHGGYVLVATDDGLIEWKEENGGATVTISGKNLLVCPTCDGNLLDFLVNDETARFVSVDGETSISMELEEPMTLEAVAGEPTGTCEEGVTTTYTASGSYNDIPFTVSGSITTEAGQHAYGEPVFYWTDDNSSAKAEFSCTRCDDVQNVDCEIEAVDTAPTCTEDGKKGVIATAEGPDGETYTDEKVETVPATGHNYSVAFTWNEDDYTATAVLTCSNCKEGDEGHVVSDLEAEVTFTVTTEATCTDAGEGVYTASVEYEGVTYTDDSNTGTKAVEIPAKGHDYGEPVYTWSEDMQSATATFTCRACDVEPVTVECSVQHNVVEPTYTKTGSDAYIATVNFNGTDYTDIESETIPKKTLATPKLSKASNSNGGVTVTWNAVEDATAYQVYRKPAGVKSWSNTKLDGGLVTTTSFKDTTAVSGESYVYTVRAIVEEDGASAMSSYDKNGVSVNYIAAPVLSSVSNVTSGVTLKWEKVDGAAKYRVFRKVSGAKSWTKLTVTTSTSYT